MHNDKTVCDIVADIINSDDKKRIEFLTVKKEEQNIAVRDAVVYALSTYGKGEGLVPIATTNRGYIIAGYPNPKDRTGEPISTGKHIEESMWHSKLYSKSFAADIARVIPYYVLKQYIQAVDSTLPAGLTTFVKSHFSSSLCNVNPSYRRERYNLILSVKEYDTFPKELDADSVAGMNLSVVTEMLLRMAIMQEDLKGNKTIIKKSDVDGNPLIREGVKDLIYQMVTKQIKDSRKQSEEDKAKSKAKEKKAEEQVAEKSE